MAQIIKVSGYIVSPNGEVLPGDIENFELHGEDVFWQHLHTDVKQFEWDDQNPLNFKNCDLAHCEKFFASEPHKKTDREVVVGGKYRHFKEGKIVTVLAVSQDTENPGSFSVVYECDGKVWHRPYDMFTSLVDNVKYPNATQKYRFEYVEE